MIELLPKSLTNISTDRAAFYSRHLDSDSSGNGRLRWLALPRGGYKQNRIWSAPGSRKAIWLGFSLSVICLLGIWILPSTQPDSVVVPVIPIDDGGEIPLGQSRLREGREVFWWEDFPRLHGLYRGRKRVIPVAQNTPEQFEHETITEPTLSRIKPRVSLGISQCYIDNEKKIAGPEWSAINGLPQGMSAPLFGSHQELGLKNDICYDRLSRFTQYGLDAPEQMGGTGNILKGDAGGTHTANSIDWRKIKWRDAQDKCLDKNKDVISSRTAFVIRTWHNFRYTPLHIIMLRAIVSELALVSGGEYEVHFLIHVQDDSIPIWASEEVYNKTLKDSLPREFEGMGTLWSVAQMHLVYPPPFPASIDNFSGGDVYDAYRSLHFPLQLFASEHPEFDYFWQWEMDMRVTGHYYELLHQITRWAEAQPRAYLWERSSKFFIPSLYNNSFSAFSNSIESEMATSNKTYISGPQISKDQLLPVPKQKPSSPTGEITDLITFNPLFDPSHTRWAFHNDITGYTTSRPPTRAALITASRLSRRLLLLMHEETYQHKHTMFPEMFPASIALHYGLKAVYAPLPVYFDRSWPAGHADEIFNNAPISPTSHEQGMPDHGNGFFHGEGGSVFGPGEHVFRGSTYYSNALFSEYLWRRWLGRENRNGELDWESDGGPGGGRMCLPMMVLHPIKSE